MNSFFLRSVTKLAGVVKRQFLDSGSDKITTVSAPIFATNGIY